MNKVNLSWITNQQQVILFLNPSRLGYVGDCTSMKLTAGVTQNDGPWKMYLQLQIWPFFGIYVKILGWNATQLYRDYDNHYGSV